MSKADNIRRLDEAAAMRNQPAPISLADLCSAARARFDAVTDRLETLRAEKARNDETIAALTDDNAAKDAEAEKLQLLADAMLGEIHTFERIGQGR